MTSSEGSKKNSRPSSKDSPKKEPILIKEDETTTNDNQKKTVKNEDSQKIENDMKNDTQNLDQNNSLDNENTAIRNKSLKKGINDSQKPNPQKGNSNQQIDKSDSNLNTTDKLNQTSQKFKDFKSSPFLKATPKRKMSLNRVNKSWDLNNIIHLKPIRYEPLKDLNLQAHFVKPPIREYLKKKKLITRDGFIIENPETYHRNLKLLKVHYNLQSMPLSVKIQKKIPDVTKSIKMSKSQGKFRITKTKEVSCFNQRKNSKKPYQPAVNSQDYRKFMEDVK